MDTQHATILVLFLLLMIIISAVFVYIFRSSIISNSAILSEQVGLARLNQKRFLLFIILAAVLVIIFSVTIQKTPYYLYADEEPERVVFVSARQFSYATSFESIKPDDAMPNEEIILPLGKIVEFRVTSFDVNHGFAIYDEDNQLVAQTQAMPGYVNRLRWKFEYSGTYKVLCLEFCGLAHAYMSTSFSVK